LLPRPSSHKVIPDQSYFLKLRASHCRAISCACGLTDFCTSGIEITASALSHLGGEPSKDEHIFCHKDGKPIHSFKKGFLSLITKAGVAVDREGARRTIYSLRHTYATVCLQHGINHYFLARNIMRTLVTQMAHSRPFR
jgi:hypothetical protein